MPKLIRILNIDIQSISSQYLLHNLKEGVVLTPNVDHLVKLQKDKSFYTIYKGAEWVVCDSNIVALASRFLGTSIKEVIPGSSFFPQFCDFHRVNKNINIFLLGAKEGVAEQAKIKINDRIGRQIVVGAHSPSFGFEKNEQECIEIIDIINKTKANVLLVGVGAPKQEKWIHTYRNQLPFVKIYLALGATIDFEAGNIKRAPIFFQRYNIEWLYRLIKEPKRLYKRYLVDDIPFFYYLFLQKLGRYINPFKD
jgi:exopolysaccharide biosynthesis WecB/TagA/CpsF family protein